MSLFILFPLIFTASFILTMVGLGGGLIFSPLFVLLHFPVSTAVSASLFLNGIAAISAAITYFQKKMVDVKIAIPFFIFQRLSGPHRHYPTGLEIYSYGRCFLHCRGAAGFAYYGRKIKRAYRSQNIRRSAVDFCN